MADVVKTVTRVQEFDRTGKCVSDKTTTWEDNTPVPMTPPVGFTVNKEAK